VVVVVVRVFSRPYLPTIAAEQSALYMRSIVGP